MRTRIIAFDPGGTTGWATATFDDLNHDTLFFAHGYLPGPGIMHHADLYTLLDKQLLNGFIDKYFVVSESFEFRNEHRDGIELISRDYLGVIELWCQRNNTELYTQKAAQGKVRGKFTAFVKPSNLKALGLFVPGAEWRHSMDGYGHLLYFMIHGPIPFFRNELLAKGWKDNA